LTGLPRIGQGASKNRAFIGALLSEDSPTRSAQLSASNKEYMTITALGRLAWKSVPWALACFIVFATWGPQSLRPHLGDPQVERFGAYFVTTIAFVFAYPRRPWTIAAAAVAVAVLLELGQLAIPGRDAGVPDAIAKALGGLAGDAVAVALLKAGRILAVDGR
jgi:VanZ family protein